MFANLQNYVQISPSLAMLSERLQLKQVRQPHVHTFALKEVSGSIEYQR